MAIAALSLTVGVGAAEVQFSELPRKAQQTINKYLNGGIVQDIDQKSINGRTVYEVEVRREGRNRHLKVDADGKLLAATTPGRISADADVDDGGVFNKNDGKILGVFNNPNNDKGVEAEARVADGEVSVDADVDTDVDVDKTRDRGITEDVFDKNDGKILDVVPAPSRNDGAKVEGEVDLDTDNDKKIEADLDLDNDKRVQTDVDVDLDDDNEVAVEANTGEGKGLFRKGDGKILGIPVPGRDADNDVSAEVEVDSNKDHVTKDVDGGLDTDKNDGRILGVPKRGFETLSLSDVPPVVRETIRREAGGYKVAEIEKATAEGRMVYEVDIERDGKNRELHVAADGTILKDTDRGAVGAPGTIERGADRD
jgi:uncharacterized membrane protein YkoI